MLSLDFVRFYLHAHPDSSNLGLLILKVFQDPWRELPELGSHGWIVRQNDKGPGLEVHHPGRRREERRGCFDEQLLQVAQAARMTGKRLEVARAGDDIADLLSGHRGVSGAGR